MQTLEDDDKMFVYNCGLVISEEDFEDEWDVGFLGYSYNILHKVKSSDGYRCFGLLKETKTIYSINGGQESFRLESSLPYNGIYNGDNVTVFLKDGRILTGYVFKSCACCKCDWFYLVENL